MFIFSAVYEYILKAAWFEVAILRTTTTKAEIAGGLSELASSVLETFFGEPHDARQAGFQVDVLGHGSLRIYLDIGYVLADESALHALFASKGSSGLKPCYFCLNIYNKNTARQIVERDTSGWPALFSFLFYIFTIFNIYV